MPSPKTQTSLIAVTSVVSVSESPKGQILASCLLAALQGTQHGISNFELLWLAAWKF